MTRRVRSRGKLARSMERCCICIAVAVGINIGSLTNLEESMEQTTPDNATWQDADGKTHKRYVVRSMGPGRGFGVVDRYRNMVIHTGSFATRQAVKPLASLYWRQTGYQRVVMSEHREYVVSIG